MGEFDFCISCFHQINKEDVCPYCGKKQYGFTPLPFQLKANTLLNGRYIIGEVLGFGGFGITYKAYDVTLNQIIAIKEFYPAGLVNRAYGESRITVLRENEFAKGKLNFIEEAKKSVTFFGSKNIVNVFDYFEANNTVYLKMEFLDGISLKDFISQGNGIVDVPTAVNITKDILNGVSELHKNGYIHCDLSPDNIMITADNRIVIIDLGAAKKNNHEQNVNDDKVLKIGYAPPEQYQEDSALGNFTDIYAVGAILYRMLTGKVPEESNDRTEKDTLEEPCALNNKIPKHINNICMRALALNSSLRLQSTEQFLNGLNGKLYRTEKQEKRFRKITALSTVAAVLVIMAVSITFGIVYRVYNNVVKLDKYIKEPATVSIWVPYATGSYETVKSVYDELFADFQNELKENETFSSTIDVNVEYVDKDKYSRKMQTAIQDGAAPDIYSGALCNDKQIQADISWVRNKVLKESYTYAAMPTDEILALPAGFDCNVIYINRKYDSEGVLLKADSVSDFESKAAALTQELSLEDATLDFNDPLKRTKFIKGKTVFYCGRISELQLIKPAVSWLSMTEPVNQEYGVRYCDYWSVFKGEEPNYAAMYVLSYLLSESAQELMCIENDSCVPLNKNTLDVYITETHKNDNLAYLNEIK